MSMIGTLYAKLGLNTTEWDRKMKSVGASTARLGKKLTMGLTLPIAALGVGVVKTFADFEQSLANAGAVAGATGEEMEAMEAKAREMGATTMFSAKEAADAFYYMASAGWEVDKMGKAIKPTLDLAAATQFDLAQTTSLVISSLNMFGLAAEDTGRVTNAYAAVIGSSQATMDKLGISMTYIGPVAKSLGWSIEESAAAMGKLYDQGLEASQAGTSLRGAMFRLLDPTEKTHKALARLGLKMKDVNPETRSLAEIVQTLGDRHMGAQDAVRLFGKIGSTAILKLVDIGAPALTELTDKITGTTDASDMAARMLDTFSGQMKLVKSALSEVAISLGKILIPMLKKLIDEHILPAINWFSQLTDRTKKFILIGAGIAAALGPVLMVFGKLLIVGPKIVGLIGMIGKALMFLAANPIGLVVVAVAGLAYVIVKNWTTIKEFTIKIFTYLKAFWMAYWDTIGSKVFAVFKAIFEIIKTVGGKIIDVAKIIVGGLLAKWKSAYNVAKTIFIAIAQAILGALKKLAEKIAKLPIIKKFGEKFKEALDKTTESLDDSTEAMEAADKAAQDMDSSAGDLKDTTVDLSAATFESRDAVAALVEKEEAAAAAAKSLNEILKTLGVRTLPEKKARVAELVMAQGALNKKYVDGLVDATEYAAGIKTIEEELRDLKRTMEGEAIPAARDFSDILGTTADKFKDEDAVKFQEGMKETASVWDTMADGLQTKWASTIGELLSGATSLKDGLKGMWDAMKQQFFDIIGQMLAKFLTDFIGGLLSGASSAASSIAKSLGEMLGGSGTSSIAQGASSLTGAIGGLANPVSLIAQGITAMAAVASLFKGQGPTTTELWLMEQTWIEQRNLTLFTMNTIGSSSGWLAKIHDKTNKVVLKNEYQMKQNRKQIEILEGIGDGIGKVVQKLGEVIKKLGNVIGKLKAIGNLQHGGLVISPTLAVVGEAGPEAVIPLDKLSDFLATAGGITIHIDYAPEIRALDSADVENFMFGRGKDALLKAIQYNVDEFAKKSKEEYDKFG